MLLVNLMACLPVLLQCWGLLLVCRDCLQKVEDLLVKKDTLEDERNRGLKAGIEKVDNIDDNSGSDDDVDFDEFLDWRAKRV